METPYGRPHRPAPSPTRGEGAPRPSPLVGEGLGTSALRGVRGIPTYYGQPAIKAGHYRWLVVSYLFVGGLAGAAQLIAAIADLLGGRRDRAIVRTGRYLALGGALLSPVLLIKDLHTPSRWYNMLRIFRSTSPMSIGSWTLAAFGALSGLVGLGQALEDLAGLAVGRRLARLSGVPAAAAGALMSTYTGTLLASTSVPLWSTADRLLPPLFGASAAASATAAISLILELAGANRGRRRLAWLALACGGAQLALARATEREWRRQGVAGPIEREPAASIYRYGVLGLGAAVPLALNSVQALACRGWRTVSVVAAAATLAGGYLERALIVLAGRDSAGRPGDYFHLTRGAHGPTIT